MLLPSAHDAICEFRWMYSTQPTLLNVFLSGFARFYVILHVSCGFALFLYDIFICVDIYAMFHNIRCCSNMRIVSKVLTKSVFTLLVRTFQQHIL